VKPQNRSLPWGTHRSTTQGEIRSQSKSADGGQRSAESTYQGIYRGTYQGAYQGTYQGTYQGAYQGVYQGAYQGTYWSTRPRTGSIAKLLNRRALDEKPLILGLGQDILKP
jgi:hypothetical protein